MRRWLFACMLFVLPFQMVWGAVAPYCTHEASVAAKKHFGHHEHQHQESGAILVNADNGGDSLGANHADCTSCQLGNSLMLPAPDIAFAAAPIAEVLGDDGADRRSHFPSGPERPDRIELTSAARFGGGVSFGLLTA